MKPSFMKEILRIFTLFLITASVLMFPAMGDKITLTNDEKSFY